MWCNPRFGYYGAQTWRIATAIDTGICDMSGNPIKAGDAVYRPRRAYPEPVNAKSMILARIVECAEVAPEDDESTEIKTRSSCTPPQKQHKNIGLPVF
jgi:hypothetical protein